MQYVEMVGASLRDETTHGCTFTFGGIVCQTPRDSYRIVDGVLFIKQYVVKINLRSKWRGETADQWRTAHPIDESVLADITKARDAIQQVDEAIRAIGPTQQDTIKRACFKIAEALRILDHGIGNAAEVHIQNERARRDKMIAATKA